jgi:hypothetical protein
MAIYGNSLVQPTCLRSFQPSGTSNRSVALEPSEPQHPPAPGGSLSKKMINFLRLQHHSFKGYPMDFPKDFPIELVLFLFGLPKLGTSLELAELLVSEFRVGFRTIEEVGEHPLLNISTYNNDDDANTSEL